MEDARLAEILLSAIAVVDGLDLMASFLEHAMLTISSHWHSNVLVATEGLVGAILAGTDLLPGCAARCSSVLRLWGGRRATDTDPPSLSKHKVVLACCAYHRMQWQICSLVRVFRWVRRACRFLQNQARRAGAGGAQWSEELEFSPLLDSVAQTPLERSWCVGAESLADTLAAMHRLPEALSVSNKLLHMFTLATEALVLTKSMLPGAYNQPV